MSNKLNAAIWSLVPNIGSEFITFLSSNPRDYVIHFWKIGPKNSFAEFIKSVPNVSEYFKMNYSNAKAEYSFPMQEDGSVDIEKIISEGMAISGNNSVGDGITQGMEKYRKNSDKEMSEDFSFLGNGKIPLWNAIKIIEAFIDRKNCDVNAIEHLVSVDIYGFEEMLTPLLEKTSGRVCIAIDDEYGFDWDLTVGLNDIVLSELPVGRISHDDYDFERYASAIGSDAEDESEFGENVRFHSVTSRYDEAGDMRNVDTIDDVIESLLSKI